MKTPNKLMIFVTEGGERELGPDKLKKLVLSEENYDNCSLVEMIEGCTHKSVSEKNDLVDEFCCF